MKKFILFILLVHLSLQLNEQQLSQQPNKSSKLGILIRLTSSSSLDRLNAYLHNLASQKCKIVSEFNIIWANLRLGDSVQTLKKSLSTYTGTTVINIYNVNFGETNFKFRIPANSKADIYYVSDLQFNESCSDITHYYLYSQKGALAGLIPLIGENQMISTIDTDFRFKTKMFTYQKVTNHKHFTFTENIRLLSRHFLELSQSNITEISLMANIMHPICQQIYINFIVAHFYPQLRPTYMIFKQHIEPSIDLTQKKSVCIENFIQILGYCPMFYQRKDLKKTIWSNPNLNQIVKLKRQQIEKVILHKNRNLQSIKPQFSLPTSSKNILPQKNTYLSHLTREQMIVLTLLSFITILFVSLRFVSLKIANLEKQRAGTLSLQTTK